ncbi:MAG: hypothetical protein SOH95_07570 [Bifidobacterium crudilactis]
MSTLNVTVIPRQGGWVFWDGDEILTQPTTSPHAPHGYHAGRASA